MIIRNDKLDFVSINKIETKSGFILQPELSVITRDCLMTRGHAFYAVWDFENGMWSFNELRVPILINALVQEAFDSLPEHEKAFTTISDIGRFRTSEWSSFKAYCKQLPDKSRDLDLGVTFADENPAREDYRARRLPYALSTKPPRAYKKLTSVLYDPEELEKLEWAVGLCLCGEQALVHKFVAIFGGSGTGKSTYLGIIEMLFSGYTETINVHNIVNNTNDFALSRFAENPLVILQHDCNLSTIRDNSRLNSIVSHERMEINVKNQSMYTARILGMLFLGTNKPVHITDARSGIARRLIDVSPSGRLVPNDIYDKLVSDIGYELGSIANHCIQVYKTLGRGYYGSYVPIKMMVKTNVMYSFVMENANELDAEQGITLTRAFNLYKKYCEEYAIKGALDKTEFRDEIEEYFMDVHVSGGGKYQTQIVYKQLNPKMLKYDLYKRSVRANKTARPIEVVEEDVGDLLEQESLFDELRADCKAQYTTPDGSPLFKWASVNTTLSAINTRELHYVRLPKSHIVIDLDLRDENGDKRLNLNLEAARRFPETYSEVSKSGEGVHLHYIYEGDVDMLDRAPEPGVEVKVFTGKSSLRRKLTLCNNTPIATISSGLKTKEAKTVKVSQIKDEKHLRALINKALKKQVHADTRSSVDFIKKTVEDAIAGGVLFDVSDLYPQLIVFAAGSTNQNDYCVEVIRTLQLSTAPTTDLLVSEMDEDEIVVYDVEVFKNLFMLSYVSTTLSEVQGMTPQEAFTHFTSGGRIKTLINPDEGEVAPFVGKRLVDFNGRKYDRHMLYARYNGETTMQLFLRSQAIISGRDTKEVGYIPSAWGMGYLDLYDLATLKMSLKKWEVTLKIPHLESEAAWDQELPEERWGEMAEYNRNDVAASCALLAHLCANGDLATREIIANISGLPTGQTLRNHFAEIIFQGDRNPQKEFVYTDLSELFPGYTYTVYETEVKDQEAKVKVKSDYLDTDPSEGGRVYTEPGVYDNVVLMDVESMHPTSIIELNLFGTRFTQRYKALRDIRVALKHSLDEGSKSPVDSVREVAQIEQNDYNADIYAKALEVVSAYSHDRGKIKHVVTALKLGLNSTYGWTSATFPNPFRDPRNVDNIVAKRGALFMIALENELRKVASVIHVKTDSIKIPNATPEILELVHTFGTKYGYKFVHEDTYVRMCLINKSVYIAYSNAHQRWEATGAQFAHPVVFKSLFTEEPLTFDDFVEVKEVKGDIWMEYGADVRRHIGRIGEFVAVRPEFGGDVIRVAGEKRSHVSGTKGYHWEEADRVPALNRETYIDHTYYDKIVSEAAAAIEAQMRNRPDLAYAPQSGENLLDQFTQVDDIRPPFSGPYLKGV